MKEKIQNHFGMSRLPFSKTISTSELFITSSIKSISERLSLAVGNEDFALISGTAGSGKSSAIRYFISQLDKTTYPHVYITAEKYKIGDIGKLILHGLNMEVPYNGYEALRKLHSVILKLNSDQNIKPVIVIDEAQELPISTLSSIKNITNFEIDSRSRIAFIFVGQSQLINKLNMNELSSLKRRIRIRFKFNNLSVEDTMRFIEHQLKMAGVTKAIFTEDAKNEIFRLSNGIICNINNICYDLIVNAVEKSLDIIEPSLLNTILAGE
ncbi:AAA family ATPase [bacterium]|nr:AAA family ATPase [bacterium]